MILSLSKLFIKLKVKSVAEMVSWEEQRNSCKSVSQAGYGCRKSHFFFTVILMDYSEQREWTDLSLSSCSRNLVRQNTSGRAEACFLHISATQTWVGEPVIRKTESGRLLPSLTSTNEWERHRDTFCMYRRENGNIFGVEYSCYFNILNITYFIKAWKLLCIPVCNIITCSDSNKVFYSVQMFDLIQPPLKRWKNIMSQLLQFNVLFFLRIKMCWCFYCYIII